MKQIHILLVLFFTLYHPLCFAERIDKPTTIKNTTLNLTEGYVIEKAGSLDIEDSVVNVNISPSNSFFTQLNGGTLKLKHNIFNVIVSGITPNANALSLFHLIKINQGTVNITGNEFTVDTFFTVGLLTTNPNFKTTGLTISHNTIQNFHGGLYLINSNHAEVFANRFENVSYSNIFNIGNMNNYTDNIFAFPGNLSLGNAFDFINSSYLKIRDNIITSASNFGMHVMGCQHLIIDNNKLTDGASYGIFIAQTEEAVNNHITISNNYLEQNRFGVAAEKVNDLVVENNTFIQHFTDPVTRQFWTNNDVLLSHATNVTWMNNLYREAFTQVNGGDNSLALQFVPFPAHRGVTLP